MKKFKSLKKLMVLALAVVTVFTMAGITSYAANETFGGISVDLGSDFQRISGAKDAFINDLTNSSSVVFTSESDDINLIINNGEIYGTPKEMIKESYDSNIRLEHGITWTFNWGTQKTRSLNDYIFVNQIPESINVPVPFYFEQGEGTGNWIFSEDRPNELSDSTKVNVQNLRSLMKDNNFNYTYDSGTLHYTPVVKYRASNGVELTSSNNAAWKFNVPMSAKYTVDIKPLNAGGTPDLGGNNTALKIQKISDTNKEFLRDGEISNSFENNYTAPEGTTDQTLLGYGQKYSIGGTTFDDSIVVMNTSVKVADPLTGTGSIEGVTANTVGGKTHITVEYGKNVSFQKVDEEKNPVAGAEFTVYSDEGCKNAVSSGKSDKSGAVKLSTLRMPEVGENVTYYMKETKTPDGYEQNDSVYTITINDEGIATIDGKDFGTDGLVNYKPKEPVITKDGSTPTHVKNGDFITYNLTVTNNYKDKREIIVKDELPNGVVPVGYYYLDGSSTEESWNGQWKGTVPAATVDENGKVIKAGERKFTIIVRVTNEFDAVDSSKNVIKNKASLQTKNLVDDKYGEEKETPEVKHYLDPKVSYTMTKERVTQPKDDLKGFIAGAGEVIDYKVTLKNTGNLDLNINLKDVFANKDYFTFINSDEADVVVEAGKSKVVTFKATVNTGTPENIEKGYLNTVTSTASGKYIDAEDLEEKIVDKDHGVGYSETNQVKWDDAVLTSKAYTPVIEVGDPTITKTSDPETGNYVKKDGTIIYTLTVENPYNIARKIIVTDVLPKQVKATDDYLINGKSQGKAWRESYEGTIDANSKLVFEIPVTVMGSFNDKDHDSNTILNQASLKVKDLLTNEYGEEIFTKKVTHYLEPMIGYTMNKVRVTQPKAGLNGFYAGTGEVIDYKVTLENIGDITLDVDLKDIFVNSEYFEFVDTNKASVTIEPGETRDVVFQATIKSGTPAHDSYQNVVTSIAQGSYLDAKTHERVLVNQDNWPDAKIEDDAFTPVIAPEVKPVDPAKPSVGTGDNSSIALFGSLAAISGLVLVLKRKKEDQY